MIRLSSEQLEHIKNSNLPEDIKQALLTLNPGECYLSNKEIIIDDIEASLASHDLLFEELTKDQQDALIYLYNNMSFQHHDDQIQEMVDDVLMR